VTRAILLANVLLAFAVVAAHVWLVPDMARRRGIEVPPPAERAMDGLLGPYSLVLDAFGGNVPRKLVEGREWWRVLCAVFLHGGILHLLMNMAALLSLGPLVEEMYGGGKALALYLLTGVAASVASIRFGHAPDAPHIGASGALMGLVGLVAGVGLRVRGETGKALLKPMLRTAGLTLLVGFLVPVIDNAAHVGGFVAGLPCGYFLAFGVRATGDPDRVRRWDLLAILLAAALVASFVPPAIALARR